MSERIAWGIIGAGGIARTFARELPASRTGALVAVGSRAQDSADLFGKEFGLTKCYGSYEGLLADPDVQAVYIATPHPMHAEWAIKSAEAGKHILCEKPLTVNYAEAAAVVDAVRKNDVFLMEAFMYRCHPQTTKLVELIKEKTIGEVRLIEASFSFKGKDDPRGRLLNNALGGGAILDVGCYCVSMARLVAGAAMGRDFAEPIELKAVAKLNEHTGVDEFAAASVKFPGEILAQLFTGIFLHHDNTLRIFGSEGRIVVPMPWTHGSGTRPAKILVTRYSEGEPREVVVQPESGPYALEADALADHLSSRQAPPPCMTWDDSLGNMKMLDWWRREIGLVYEFEK